MKRPSYDELGGTKEYIIRAKLIKDEFIKVLNGGADLIV